MVTIKVSKQLQDYIDKCHTPDGHAIGTVHDLQQFSKSRKELAKVVDTLQEQLALHSKMLDEYNQLTVKQMQYDMSTIDDILPIWMVADIVKSTPLENYYKSGDKYTEVVKRFREENDFFGRIKAYKDGYDKFTFRGWRKDTVYIPVVSSADEERVIEHIASTRQYSYDNIIFDSMQKQCVHYDDEELQILTSHHELSITIKVDMQVHQHKHFARAYKTSCELFKLKSN